VKLEHADFCGGDGEMITLMPVTAEKVSWRYRQPGISVQFNVSHIMQLSILTNDKNPSSRTNVHHYCTAQSALADRGEVDQLKSKSPL